MTGPQNGRHGGDDDNWSYEDQRGLIPQTPPPVEGKDNPANADTGAFPPVNETQSWGYEQSSFGNGTNPQTQQWYQGPSGAQDASHRPQGVGSSNSQTPLLIILGVAIIAILIMATFIVTRAVKDNNGGNINAAAPTSSEMIPESVETSSEETTSEETTTSSSSTPTTTSSTSSTRSKPSRSQLPLPSEAEEVADVRHTGFDIYRIPPRGRKHGASEMLALNIADRMSSHRDSNENWTLHGVPGKTGKLEIHCVMDGSGIGWRCTGGKEAVVYVIR